MQNTRSVCRPRPQGEASAVTRPDGDPYAASIMRPHPMLNVLMPKRPLGGHHACFGEGRSSSGNDREDRDGPLLRTRQRCVRPSRRRARTWRPCETRARPSRRATPDCFAGTTLLPTMDAAARSMSCSAVLLLRYDHGATTPLHGHAPSARPSEHRVDDRTPER